VEHLLAGLQVPGRKSLHVALDVGRDGVAAWVPGVTYGPRDARGCVYAETLNDALSALVKDVRARAQSMRTKLASALRGQP
jgi:hypothetical protein